MQYEQLTEANIKDVPTTPGAYKIFINPFSQVFPMIRCAECKQEIRSKSELTVARSYASKGVSISIYPYHTACWLSKGKFYGRIASEPSKLWKYVVASSIFSLGVLVGASFYPQFSRPTRLLTIAMGLLFVAFNILSALTLLKARKLPD